MNYIYDANGNYLAKYRPTNDTIYYTRKFLAINNNNVKRFILLHEISHKYARDETGADLLATSFYLQLKLPLRDLFQALIHYTSLPYYRILNCTRLIRNILKV
jgi:hypothetical protein